MDAGAWLPLRTRYLPRWHHTGSYQLYQGEVRGAARSANAPFTAKHRVVLIERLAVDFSC